jgi:hypothetical protein
VVDEVDVEVATGSVVLVEVVVASPVVPVPVEVGSPVEVEVVIGDPPVLLSPIVPAPVDDIAPVEGSGESVVCAGGSPHASGRARTITDIRGGFDMFRRTTKVQCPPGGETVSRIGVRRATRRGHVRYMGHDHLDLDPTLAACVQRSFTGPNLAPAASTFRSRASAAIEPHFWL